MTGLFNGIDIGELAFLFRCESEVAFLTRKRPVVLFGIKHNIHRDSAKSLTFAPTYKVDTLLAPEWGRRFIIYKM